jgi:diphthamide synthase (EF-2-diphthine--ammonia ligase)
MPLTDNEQTELREHVALAGELGEPETIVATMAHYAKRKASERTTDPDEARRWRNLSNALEAAQGALSIEPKPKRETEADQEQASVSE